MILAYWPIKGRAEPLMCLAAYLGVEITEKRYSDPAEWEADKANKIVDFPNLPYLIDGNIRLSQTDIIAAYICDKAGSEAFGKVTADRYKVAEILGVYGDIFTDIRTCFLAAAEGGADKFKQQYSEAVTTGGVFAKAKQISEFLGNKEFLLGYVTYADILIGINALFLDQLSRAAGTVSPFVAHANIDALSKRIYALPGIKERTSTPQWKATPWMPPQSLPFPLAD